MKTQFVFATSENDAWNACPWAAQIIPVPCGWMAFESLEAASDWQVANDEAIAVFEMADYSPFRVNAV